jgi:hypothetical protein
MSKSRNAAVLMLVGAVAASGATGYVLGKYAARSPVVQPIASSQRGGDQSQRAQDYKNIVYNDLMMDDRQKAAWDSLLSARRRAVEELFATPRAKQDSINADTRAKQRAILRPDQLAKLDARIAEMRQRSADRRKQDSVNKAAGKSKNNTPRQ